MGNVNKTGKMGKQHDGQTHYQHSNQRNPDNIRDNTRDRQYKEHDQTLTNDANYDINANPSETKDMDFDDTKENVGK